MVSAVLLTFLLSILIASPILGVIYGIAISLAEGRFITCSMIIKLAVGRADHKYFPFDQTVSQLACRWTFEGCISPRTFTKSKLMIQPVHEQGHLRVGSEHLCW